MARIVNHQINDITTDADGTRRSNNAGTSGIVNDVVLDTGQMLQTDGVDDIIYPLFYPNDLTCKTFIVSSSWISGENDGIGTNAAGLDCYFKRGAGGLLIVAFGSSVVNTIFFLELNKVYRLALTFDGAEAHIYINGVFFDKFATTFIGSSGKAFAIGNISNNAGAWHNGNSSNLQVWDIYFNSSDINNDFINSEWVYIKDNILTIDVSIGSLLTAVNIMAWFPITE